MIKADDENYSYPLHMSGSISTLPAEDDPDEIIKRLHAVVREVTGKDVEQPEKPRMGFY